MRHIKTPVGVFPHWAQTDIRDSDGTVLVSCASGHEGEMIAGEIKRALGEHGDLVAQRDALVAACKAQQRALDILHAVILSNGGFLTVPKRAVYQGALIETLAALDLVKGGECSHQQPDGCCGDDARMSSGRLPRGEPMDIEDLKRAIAEYLKTCDDEAEEEEYTTNWQYAQRQLSLFVKWLEENGRESALALADSKGGECPHQQPDGCCGHAGAMTPECHRDACPEEEQCEGS